MNHLSRFKNQLFVRMLLVVLASNLILLTLWYFGSQGLKPSNASLAIYLVIAALLIALIFTKLFIGTFIRPIEFLWQAVMHVKPDEINSPAPNIAGVKLGREMVTTLSREIYDLVGSKATTTQIESVKPVVTSAHAFINDFPLPTLTMDKNQNILAANSAALQYFGLTNEDLLNKPMFEVLDFEFPNENTYEIWLNEVRKNSVSATSSWERVRLNLPAPIGLRQLDMASSYKKDDPNNFETIIALFDHTGDYKDDDDAISFVAIAVHELRNPVTLLRGYIDVFEEELEGKLDAEMADFMVKMQVSAGQLTAFINNILNVSRVENDRLTLELSEQKWPEIVQSAIDGISLRAKVHHKTIEYTAPKELPTVGVDRVSIYEAVSNLLDNAIKYSGEGNNKIIVTTELTKDGLIETKVQDFGVGITSNVLPKLFEKFYRNHRTQATVGGTGLGLYLSKAIIDAHGGNVWVNSKEGEGTTFGFTLLPYVMIANKIKSGSTGITRNAHGWIKNHSLYRR